MLMLLTLLVAVSAAIAISPIGLLGSRPGGTQVAAAMPAVGPDDPATIKEPTDWLKYHSECREYLLVMGQKFTGLLGQASVFSLGAVTAILTVSDRAKYGFPDNLYIAIPSAMGLSMYTVIILKYFLQVRATGRLMSKLEGAFLGRNQVELGLIHVLVASNGGFYGKQWTLWMTALYATVLTVLPLIVALLVEHTSVLRTVVDL